MTPEKWYEQHTAELLKELEAREIPRETVDKALEVLGDILPTLPEIDSTIRLAYYGIACYHAGYTADRGL